MSEPHCNHDFPALADIAGLLQCECGVLIDVDTGTAYRLTPVDEWPDHGRKDIIVHNTEEAPAVVIRPGQPIHVFGYVDVITGRYGAEEKLAELDRAECRHCGECITQDSDSGEWLHVDTDGPVCDGFESVAEPNA